MAGAVRTIAHPPRAEPLHLNPRKEMVRDGQLSRGATGSHADHLTYLLTYLLTSLKSAAKDLGARSETTGIGECSCDERQKSPKHAAQRNFKDAWMPEPGDPWLWHT